MLLHCAPLQDHGAPRQGVAVKEVVKEGNTIDVSVAERDLAAGELALRIPDHLVITLSRVFEDEVQPGPIWH
jgi:histone-lysine N-methyltransferase SETD3